jgi:hypothetical protein
MSTKASKKVTPSKKQRFPIWLLLIVVAGVALIVVALIGNGGGQAASTVAPQVTGTPSLQVDKEKIDFGDVKLGQTVEARFEVTNVGDQPLRFTAKPYIEVIEGC